MTDNKQPVEAAGLLSSLIKSLFGNLGKILDFAAEYEEEMGVMKQVTRIPLEPENGNGRTYWLTIKLSPIKDKKGKYYVEAHCDKNDFDVSSINGKVIDLNGENMKDFDKMVNDLIKKNNLYVSDETETEEDVEVTEEEKEAAAEEISDDLDTHLEQTNFTATTQNNDTVNIAVNYDMGDVCTLNLTVEDSKGNPLDEYPSDTYECDIVTPKGNAVSFSSFWNDVKDSVNKYATKNNLTLKGFTFASENIVCAKFIRSKESDDIEMMSITASCDIKAALDMVQDVADSDEFDEMIGEEPVALQISEDSDGYTVEEIEDVDVSGTYEKMFETINLNSAILTAYKWASGPEIWYAATSCDNIDYQIKQMEPEVAMWVRTHSDKFVVPKGIIDDSIVDVILKDNTVDTDLLKGAVKAIAEDTLSCLDFYYVNLEHDEQSMVDQWITELKRIIAFV